MPTSDLGATMVAVAVPRRYRHGSTVHSFRRGASVMTTRFHTVPRTRAGRAGCLVTCLLIALGATGSAAGSRSVARGETSARGSSGYRVELTAIGSKEVTDLRIEIRPGAGRPDPTTARRGGDPDTRSRAVPHRFDDPPQCPRLGRSRRDRASAPPRRRARPRRGARIGRSASAVVLRACEHLRSAAPRPGRGRGHRPLADVDDAAGRRHGGDRGAQRRPGSRGDGFPAVGLVSPRQPARLRCRPLACGGDVRRRCRFPSPSWSS